MDIRSVDKSLQRLMVRIPEVEHVGMERALVRVGIEEDSAPVLFWVAKATLLPRYVTPKKASSFHGSGFSKQEAIDALRAQLDTWQEKRNRRQAAHGVFG